MTTWQAMIVAEEGEKTMRWTTETPKNPGWYWWRWQEYGERIQFVEIEKDGTFWTPNEFALQDGEWAGPIERPEDGA